MLNSTRVLLLPAALQAEAALASKGESAKALEEEVSRGCPQYGYGMPGSATCLASSS